MESISDFRASGFGALMAVPPVARVALPSQKNAPATSVVGALLPLGGVPGPELAKAAGLIAVEQNLGRSVKRRRGVGRRFQVGLDEGDQTLPAVDLDGDVSRASIDGEPLHV